MSDQIQDRKNKLDAVRALGVDPYGARFPGLTHNAAIRAAGEKLAIEPGQINESPQARFRAAGRLHLARDTGKLIFLTLRDWSGELQWALSKKAIEEASERRSGAVTTGGADVPPGPTALPGEAALPGEGALTGPTAFPGEAVFPPGAIAWQIAKTLDLGDIVAAEGRLGRTKTGELTLWVSHLTMLSKCLRPPPEKWHGLSDVELRYRKRYVDLLANPESQRQFILRAKIIDYIRGVLHARGFIEVETPVLQPIYGGAAARPFTTHHNTLDMELYLRISPELYLKRCLVGGLERVYEFARCFRNEGISPRHNPEFTMLELYQAYGDYHDMMEISEAIIAGAAREVIGSYRIATKRERATERRSDGATEGSDSTRNRGSDPSRGREGAGSSAHPDPSADARDSDDGSRGRSDASDALDFTPPWPRRRYAELFGEHVGLSIDDTAAVRARAAELHRRKQIGLDPSKADDAVVIGALFEHYVEPKLINPTFVIDYPAPLCPLTKRHPTDARFALRFECFVNGMEMGNAYSELNDPAVQRETLAAQLRGEGDETMAVMDEDFCEALEYAMPPAGGLGIGIDRLCMLLTGSPSIRDALLFPLQRAPG
ncbi:MAG: Lysine--tRNA ligase [Phycisphaerae bacterium]|nr:Lysine--tRNA ligase [Phycisphaerae bacterium]